MCVGFKTTSHTVTSEFRRLIGQPKVGLLLDEQVIDNFILALKLDFYDLELGLEASILVFQIIGGHALFHHIVVEALTLLMNDSRAKLAHIELDLTGCLARSGPRTSSHHHLIGAREAQFFAKVELSFAASCARPPLGNLCWH